VAAGSTDNNADMTTSSSITSSDQWAPTPLAEIRAKQLRRQMQRSQQTPSPPDGTGATNSTDSTVNSNAGTTMPPPPQLQQSSALLSQPCSFQQPLQTAQQACLPQSMNQPQQQHALLQPPGLLSQPVILQQPQLFQQQQQQQLPQPPQSAALGGVTHQQSTQPALTVDMAQQLRQYHLQLQQLQQQQQSQRQQQAQTQGSTQPQQQNQVLQRGAGDTSVMSASSAGSQTMTATQQQQSRSAVGALPSTVIPPSVLTSILPLGTGSVTGAATATAVDKNTPSTTSTTSVAPPAAAAATRNNKAQSNYKKRGATTTKSARVESPQDVLERITSLRGYAFCSNAGSSLRIKSEDACYDSVPSPLQLASFGTELVKAIHVSDVEKLGRLLSTGLSPNPCNQFRDSIVDLVCKRANAAIFQCLVDHGCDLRVCDGFGRTPMHHCCWASEFCPDIASCILQTDLQQLFMEDKRGQTPLEYVRPEQAPDWINYLEDNANKLFPPGGQLPPIVSLKQARINGYLQDPPNALSVPLAKAISSGTLTPEALDGMDADAREQYV
jgi:hypothetical protein